MSKGLDPQVIISSVSTVVDDIISQSSAIVSSQPMENKEIEIVEYQGRMRAIGMEKFSAPSFISVVNFYLNAADLEKRQRAKGAFILYIDFENAGKLFKNVGFQVPEDEDDASMINTCGEFCKLLAENFKNQLSRAGFADLLMSAPQNYKNSILEGAEYSPDQTTKHEFTYYFWKRKAMVIEVTLTALPAKK